MANSNVRLSNRTYDYLKKIVTLVLPATGTLYFTVAAIWGLPRAEEVVGTIAAIATFLGIVLGLSSASYERSGDKYDGDLIVEENLAGVKSLSLALTKIEDPLDVVDQDQLTFKVKKK